MHGGVVDVLFQRSARRYRIEDPGIVARARELAAKKTKVDKDTPSIAYGMRRPNRVQVRSESRPNSGF